MDEQISLYIIKHWGIQGVLIVYLIWDKYQDKIEEKNLKAKQCSGEWVSWQDVRESQQKIQGVENKMVALTEKLEDHLKEVALKDIRMAKMESEQDHLKENTVEIKENQKAMFSMIAEIKSYLIKDKQG